MNKKALVIVSVIVIFGLGIGVYLMYLGRDNTNGTSGQNEVSILYKNTDYGFTFSLPVSWQGYSIIQDSWKGVGLTNTVATRGPKILMRNPNWTTSAPYEDIPILVFTISQWNEYLAEKFSVSAAPIQASELARNNKYVFALPPRWDYDYSLGYQEAQGIVGGGPLRAFDF